MTARCPVASADSNEIGPLSAADQFLWVTVSIATTAMLLASLKRSCR